MSVASLKRPFSTIWRSKG